MKRYNQLIINMLMVTTLVACGTKTTQLTDRLETFSAKDEAGKWSLQGVRVVGTDSIVVPPDSYRRILADEHLIVCVKPVEGVNQMWVFQTNGQPLGWFDTFNRFRVDSLNIDYYLGTNYDLRFFYFPKTDVRIKTRQAVREERDTLFIQDGDEWKAFTYDGISVSLPKK